MQCPKCRKELKINWITKEAECESCCQDYHLRIRKMNLFTYFVCVVIIGVALGHLFVAVSAGSQLLIALFLILWNVALYYFLPKKWINKFLYKICIGKRDRN